ncbi:acyl-CoA N-acyltransferase [Apiosordaria backusii]|uniref:Acyl-CoA N-acyltransferase n=1 Tax=Apiosordaria backusii TaxID=314023 RepID=A0AA40AND6_9PEZI|nr:acyl-CoA N-acyltransferase [Apiosordaria backusii]
MPYFVLPALIPDIRPCYNAYFSAFTNDPSGSLLLDILFPSGVTSEEFRETHTNGTLQWWHTSETQYTYKCIDAQTGEIVGMALCDVFVKWRTEEERKMPEIGWLAGEQRKRAEQVLDGLWGAREMIMGGRPYVYIHAFAVDPDHQGKGAGSALVQAIVDLGNTIGLPIYLEATPSSENVYFRKGFRRVPAEIAQVVHEAAVLGTKEDVEVPLMVKLPQRVYGAKVDEKKVGEVWAEWQEEKRKQEQQQQAQQLPEVEPMAPTP